PRNVLDQLQSHRIGNEHEYDRDFCRGVPQIQRCNRTTQENVDAQRHEFGGHALEPLRRLVREAMFELEVAPLDVAEFRKAVADRAEIGSLLVRAAGMPEITDRGNSPALLRARRERPGGCRTKQRDERAAFHSITSSASNRNGSEIVRPRALAVLRLMTSSNFVGCSAGSSAGLAPLRILSTYAALRWCKSAMFAP